MASAPCHHPRRRQKGEEAMMLPGFNAGSSLYRSGQYFLTAPSVGAVGNGRLPVTPQQGQTFVPPCSNPLGGCYTAPDGSLLSICPCLSPGTCGPCFDLSVEGFDLGSKQICLCESVTVPPPTCCPGRKCCGACVKGVCMGPCVLPDRQCPLPP
jgi:hypothetical protein